MRRKLAVIGALGMFALVSCSTPTCRNASAPIKNFAADRDVMAEPGASVFKQKPKPKEEGKSALALERPALFKPSKTFEFDKKSGLVLYEDGKGNAQIRRGKEIIEEGRLLDKGKEGFILLTNDNYEIVYSKKGFGNIVATPDDIKERERPISR